jgi:energy-coupling factor transporter ATP-binding protein EcfA2
MRYIPRFIEFDGVTYEIPEGNLRFVIGANGTRKSTVMRILQGFLRSDFSSFDFGSFKTSRILFTGICESLYQQSLKSIKFDFHAEVLFYQNSETDEFCFYLGELCILRNNEWIIKYNGQPNLVISYVRNSISKLFINEKASSQLWNDIKLLIKDLYSISSVNSYRIVRNDLELYFSNLGSFYHFNSDSLSQLKIENNILDITPNFLIGLFFAESELIQQIESYFITNSNLFSDKVDCNVRSSRANHVIIELFKSKYKEDLLLYNPVFLVQNNVHKIENLPNLNNVIKFLDSNPSLSFGPFSGVRISKRADYYSFEVTSPEGSIIDISQIGMGLRSLLLLLLSPDVVGSFVQDPGIYDQVMISENLIFLEEPEAFMHPNLIGFLADILLQVSQSNKLFVETHSDHLIRAVQLAIIKRDFSIDSSAISIMNFGRDGSQYLYKTVGFSDLGQLSEPLYPGFNDQVAEMTLEYLRLLGNSN